MTLDDTLARLIAAVRPFPAADAQTVRTFDALGRVLAADVRSAVDVPPADNSAMDGYALRCADVPHAGTVLPVSQRIAAGSVPVALAAAGAARIFTGAQVPAGADAVVMQEDCEALDGGCRVRVNAVPRSGLSIRRRGEDVRAGDAVLRAGARITPQAMGLAASVGSALLAVARRPRVALFSTGDELVMPGEVSADRLPPGAIYNSNRFTLRGLVESLGGECDDLGIVPDRLDATRAALRQAARHADLIVSCGGVSVGEEDHLRPAVAAEGRIDLWQVAVKPGKPLAFGEVRRPGAKDAAAPAADDGVPGAGANGSGSGDMAGDGPAGSVGQRGAGGSVYFVGLPGNPVSSFITFLFVVRPLLLHLQGVADWQPRGTPLHADFDWPKPDRRRREFLRVRRNAQGGLDLFANQGSGVLTSVVWAEGVVDNPAGQAIRAGDTVRFIDFAGLLA